MHTPVLLAEVVRAFRDVPAGIIFDGTSGFGGHDEALLASRDDIEIVATDVDQDALSYAQKRLTNYGKRFRAYKENFSNIARVLDLEKTNRLSGILLDLGVSSLQFDKAEKGFSFMQDGPLRMTMGDNTPVDAYKVVNEWEEESIESILRGYGEERFARKIAHAIVVARDIAPIKTTHELRDLVIGCYPSFMRKGRINPATKTFQAIRIAVNDELGVLNRILVEAPRFVSENGVIAIISFHSLEDRIVKHAFRSLADQGLGEILTKRPIIATEEEIMANPRARSAKLRIFISYAN